MIFSNFFIEIFKVDFCLNIEYSLLTFIDSISNISNTRTKSIFNKF